MKRRSFLKSLTAGVGALPFLPEGAESLDDHLSRLSADVESASGPDALWGRVRKEFQFNPGLIHLNCGSLGATPRVVHEAVSSGLYDVEGNPAIKTFHWGREAMEVVRTQAAEFIGADAAEVAITRNTTEAMNAVATGIDLEPGDEVLTTNHEHGGGIVCWQYLRKYRGIEIKYLTMPKVVSSKQEIVDLVRDHLTPRTKVCSFSHIETINGVIMPMAEIAALTRPKDILLVCDGAQAPGMMPVDVKALGVDTYAYSGHKWLLAPKGSGLLYIRKEVQDRIHPTFLFSGYGSYTASSGTRGIPRILGYGVAMDFHEAIGRERITARCRQLNAYLRSQVDEIPSFRCLTSADPELSCALVSYALDKGKAGDVVRRLREHQVILKPAQSTYAFCEEEGLPRESYNAIRFSTHIFNDEMDIDRGVEILRQVLAET
jgi:selenocysteine lyase/cysteine desulfurase